MATEVSICNRALSSIGAKRITSLTGAEVEAAECNLHYGPERDDMLAEFPWIFARVRQPLALLSTNDREDLWSYAYLLPTNVARIEWINEPSAAENLINLGRNPNAQYEIAGETIYTNVEECYIEFTDADIDVSKFPPLFATALSWRLAAIIAMPLTQTVRVADRAYNMSVKMLERAQEHDASLERSNTTETADSIMARQGGINGN